MHTKGCLEVTAGKYKMMSQGRDQHPGTREGSGDAGSVQSTGRAKACPNLGLSHDSATKMPPNSPGTHLCAFLVSSCFLSISWPRNLHDMSALWHFFSWLLNPLPRTLFYLLYFLLYLQTPSENVNGCQNGEQSCGSRLVMPWDGSSDGSSIYNLGVWLGAPGPPQKQVNPQIPSHTQSKNLLRII